MTREKAAELLQQGAKIKHQYFDEEEFIFLDLKSGMVLTEDDYDFTEQFWELEQFKDGWEIQ